MSATILSLADYERPPAPPQEERFATVLDIPVEVTLTQQKQLGPLAYILQCRAETLVGVKDLTLREAAKLYFEARRLGILIAPSAMPMIRASTLQWVDKWGHEYGTTFPFEAFLPYLLKGRA